MPRRLIIGDDGAEHGADALALGAVLARCLAATPLVVTVLAHLEHLRGPEGADAAIERESRSLLERARGHLGETEVEARAVAAGSPPRALHDLAEQVEPIAVVIGSSHRGRAGRILLGSVGAALLSGSPSPIAVAPRGYAERPIRNLLRLGAAVNGSEESLAALDAAASLAGRVHGSLTMLAVAEPLRLSHGGQYPALDPGSYLDAAEADMARVLERSTDRLPPGLAAERRLLRGDPVAVIAREAADLDLLVLGSRAYGPVRRALLGGVSARLVEAAPCPVLVIPRTAGPDPLALAGVSGGGPDR